MMNRTGNTGVEKTIIIRGKGGLRDVTNNADDVLFTVRANNTLVLDGDVRLNGNRQNKSVVYVDGGTGKIRDTTAGPSVNLDSRIIENWE